ncbi:phosphatidate cytidylyltransferase [Massilia sp. MS-15]|uniref:phosphatidate cytidylyltransferase n=1 Tax=Massilia sp. MS-15 TaxID=2878200 RepID=UPI001CD553ED|nr:phosphatidate cytidylyltransferase [Massilia sp. MS-15]MCA1248877.1 phosphatidate cytidylyltransferase [Massilia sp. MS-15]
MAAIFPFFDTGVRIAIASLVLYGLLATSSLSVTIRTSAAAPGMLRHQVNAWWRIFPAISLALLTYPFGPSVLACTVFLLACRELGRHYRGKPAFFRFGAATLGMFVLLVGWRQPALAQFLISGAIVLQALRCRLRYSPCRIVWLLLLATTGAMYVLTLFSALPFGPRANLGWLFYLFTLTALNDIGQFGAGKLFGRRRIAPALSRNKTWEGLAGGLVISQFVSWTLGTYLSLADAGTLALYAALLSLAGFLGDLMFSAAKRSLAIKDFSALIPGHGGILDRVDSLVLTAPLLYCLLRDIA